MKKILLYDFHRRLRPTDDVDNSTEASRRGADHADSNVKLDVYDALRRLGDKERTCVTLQLVDGYPIDEIAQITGMAVGTVKSHLFRGKEKLTRFLRQNGYG